VACLYAFFLWNTRKTDGNKYLFYAVGVGWDSSVTIVTRLGLDDLGIESKWGVRYSAPVQWVPGISRGGAAVAWRLSPTPSMAKVKERIVIPLLPIWVFVACSRVTVTFMQQVHTV
jgi:hypothetical protein